MCHLWCAVIIDIFSLLCIFQVTLLLILKSFAVAWFPASFTGIMAFSLNSDLKLWRGCLTLDVFVNLICNSRLTCICGYLKWSQFVTFIKSVISISRKTHSIVFNILSTQLVIFNTWCFRSSFKVVWLVKSVCKFVQKNQYLGICWV